MKQQEANGNGCGPRARAHRCQVQGAGKGEWWCRPAPHFPDAKTKEQRAELVGEWRNRAHAQLPGFSLQCPPTSISQGVLHLVCALGERQL